MRVFIQFIFFIFTVVVNQVETFKVESLEVNELALQFC